MSLQAKPLNTNKFTTYHVENPGSGMEQVHKCAGGKPVNGIPSSQPQPFDDWILEMAIQIYIIKKQLKPAQICFGLKRSHTITNMNTT